MDHPMSLCQPVSIMEYLCQRCSGKFSASDELLSHFLQFHMGEPEESSAKAEPSKQGWTEEAIENGEELIIRIVPVNPQPARHCELQFPCGLCGTVFSSAPELREHTISVHVNEEDKQKGPAKNCPREEAENVCEECGKHFSSKYNLDRHSQLHKGVRYPCTICGKVYSQKYVWSQHMKQTHKEWRDPTTLSVEKTWRAQERCLYCSAFFPTIREIEAHVRETHGMTELSEVWR